MISSKKIFIVLSLCLMSLLMVACGSKNATSVSLSQTKQVNPIESLYNKSCVSCHLSGVAGAPRKGDVAEWTRRLDSKGMPALIESVKKGLGAMPPMGMCTTCDDQQIEALIVFMSK